MTIKNVYKSHGVSKAEADALTWALHLEEVLDGAMCGTGRTLRRATMKRLETRELVEEDVAPVVDGDGWLVNPERYRPCFKLTAAGRALAQTLKREEQALLDRRWEQRERGTE